MRNFFTITVLLSIAVGLLLFSLGLTDWLYTPKGFNFLKYSFRAILLTGSLFVFWKAVLKIVSISKNEIVKNALGLLGILFSLFILLEICFSFVLLSGGGEKTLAGKNWFNYYWKVNDLGYRDENPKDIDRAGKKNILIIGDSYVAGHGLKEENQRFSNILRTELKDCSDVFNLGVCGADTRDEFGFLASFPIKPDLIILSYVNNDIDKILEKKELFKFLKIDPRKNSTLRKFKNRSGLLDSHSFFLNFVDFIVFEWQKDRAFKALTEKYSTTKKFLESEEGKLIELTYYTNDSLMKLQLNNIDKFIDYSITNHVDILFILFPKSDDRVIDYTNKTANEPIAEHLKNKEIEVINLTQTLKRIKESERHVNKFDPHPGIYTNEVIADTIKKHLYAKGMINKLCN